MASHISPVQQVTMNLRTLCDALGGIATKWFKIGIQLGIPHNKLLEFQGSPDPLSAVIDYWLRGNVTESPIPISWKSIVVALQSKLVGEPGLAEEISEVYCQQEETSNRSNLSAPLASSHQEQPEKAKRHQPSPPSPENKMDPDMRLDLEFILERNLKEIISKYASYVDTLRIAVKEKQVATEDLRSYLLSLSATSKSHKGQRLTLLSDKKIMLKECKTITDIFDLLTTECASFLNYDIFQFIEKRYGIKDNQEELKYPEHLKAYINKHKISEFVKINPLLKSRSGSKELTLKYDIETTCSLAKLEELRKMIAEIMEISPSALEIIDIEEGCVIVTFLIPVSIADALFTPETALSLQQEEKLRAASVLWLRCNSNTFSFKEQKLHDDAFHRLKQQVTCSICLATYIDPKLLQCHHAYCQQCLMGLVQQNQQGHPTLSCPTCRQVTHLPTGGVADLRADFRANQLLEIIGKQKKEFSLALSAFNLDKREPPTEVTTPHGMHCTDHNILMELFCGSCGEAICWKCSLKGNKHFSHECEALDDTFTQCERNIESLLKTIKKAMVIFDTRSNEISYQRVGIEKEIQKTISNNVRKTELISQLHQLTQIKLKGLAAQRDHVETIQAQLGKHLHFMTDTSNHKEAVLKKSTTVKQMKELNSQLKTKLFEPSIEADTVYLPPTLHTTENGKLCAKHSLDFSKYCTVSERISIAIVGKTSTLQMRCPVQITSISSQLVFGLAGTRASTRVRCKVERVGQSLYKISYKPTIKGKHQLYIKVNGNHIRGSPFPVRAKLSLQDISNPSMIVFTVKGPTGIAVNSKQEILVIEEEAHCVTLFSPSGAKLYSFGTHGSGPEQFKSPFGIALDEKDNIIVTDRKNHRIQKFTPKGKFLTSVGALGSGPLKFYHPCGIAFNASNDKVYVVDENCRIQVLNSDLSHFSTFERKLKFYTPRHMACDSSGNVYVTDWGSRRIQVFTAEGEFLRVIDQGLKEPYGIAIDSGDKVYISDWESNAIMSTFQGHSTTLYGSKGRKPGQFYFPTGIAVDGCGVLHVCDYINNRVQVF